MGVLHDIFAGRVDALRAERRDLLAKHGDRIISNVTLAQAAGGMRGVRALVCDTSVVDPDRGLIIRGVPVLDLVDRLPEDVFALLLTGRLPDAKESAVLRAELTELAEPPGYVWDVLAALPADTHPMTMLTTALLAMERESALKERVAEGAPRGEHWRAALDDALRLLAVLPALAADIYRLRYGKGPRIPHDPGLDWAANFCRRLGVADGDFPAAVRTAAVVQSDHEGGNACAFTCHTVASALSNAYLAVSAGFNALAGPLHGLAGQVSVRWVQEALARYGGPPDEAQIEEYAWETLRAGRVIPGYGHAVLRGEDPRFTAMIAFGKTRFGDDPLFATVARMAGVIPAILRRHGKAKNPHPNVDAVTGSVWHHFGITELDFYTVPFAVSLAMGMLAQMVINRALGSPIVRPRSVSTAALLEETEGGTDADEA